MSHRRNRRLDALWIAIGILFAVVAPFACAAQNAHAATIHSPKVTTRCFIPGHAPNAAEVTVFDGKNTGTGWMYGWRVNAVTQSGGHLTRIWYTGDTFRIKAWQEADAVTWFGPHRIVSCTARILWAR